jgi:hypothetical protein
MTNQPKAAKGQVQVHVPVDLAPSYANFALVTNSASEIVMDFAQVMPRVPRATVNTRVVMTALNAKLFLRALSDHISRYESQFGEIVLPKGPHLAEQLFKPEKPDSPNDE